MVSVSGPPNAVLGSLLERLRWSPYRLATEVNHVMGAGYIHRTTPAKWLRHSVRPNPPLPALVAEILGDALGETVTADQLWPPRLSRIPAQAHGVPVVAVPEPVHASGPLRTLEEILDQWDALMRRREFLGQAPATAAFAFAPGLVGATPCADAVAAHLTLIEAHLRLDDLHGPSAVFAQALEHYRQLVAWRHSATEASHRRVIAGVAARAGELMGWLSCDLGRWVESAEYYRKAAEMAAEANDVDLYCHLVNGMSRTLHEAGQVTQALTFADAAVHAAGTVAHPAIRWYLLEDRANLYAVTGDAPACRLDLRSAEALLPAADDGEAPCYALPHNNMVRIGRWGRVLWRLSADRASLARQASDALDQALAQWPARLARGSAAVYAISAQTHVAQGAVDQAAAFTRRAFEIAASTGSTRNLRRAREARAALAPHRRARTVRELDDYLLTTRI